MVYADPISSRWLSKRGIIKYTPGCSGTLKETTVHVALNGLQGAPKGHLGNTALCSIDCVLVEMTMSSKGPVPSGMVWISWGTFDCSR